MSSLRIVAAGAALAVLLATGVPAQAFQTTPDTGKKPAAATDAQTAAVKASPDLIDALSKELGATPEQSAGAAGALFGVAKSRLKADEFSQVAKAVPGMDALLKAAPAAAAVGTTGGLSQVAGSAAGLASAASAFSKLGLKPEMVSKAVPVLTSFVTKSGGANVGSLLAGALK
ncbi:MAG TPA: DUF2780 domain-containing protein [Vicinamibacterales bacterium]|nr:DUF2780 domain-containing protein [Vicinamibacterales bacterium]